jgi:formate dehydrogenase maturation protein FdhE
MSRNGSCNLLYEKFGRDVRAPVHMTIADLCLSIRHQGAYTAMMSSQFGHDVEFYCPHCGARYVVSYTELPIADSGSEYCECCKRRMIQWNSALQPRYRLVKPSNSTQK